MAQQLQQPSTGGIGQQYSQASTQQSAGSQRSQAEFGQPQRFERPSLRQYEKTMPSEFRVALHDFNTLAEVADWSRDQSLDKGVQAANVTRTLEDLRDVAELNERLIAHDSAYGPHVAEAFLKIAHQSVQELQQHQQDPAVADTIPVVRRAIESTEKLLQSVGWQSQQVGQQWQTQQTGQPTSQSTGRGSQQSVQQTGQQPRYGRPAVMGQQF